MSLLLNALQHLGVDHVGEPHQPFLSDLRRQPVGLPAWPVSEEVNPDAGVHDHSGRRPRISSMLYIGTLPRSSMIDFARCRRISSLSAYSTVAFLVFVPNSRCASAISSSSMSMFVR